MSRRSLRRELSRTVSALEIWVEVGLERGLCHVRAGVLGNETGVVIAEFPEPRSAYEFALEFKKGRQYSERHASDWEAYIHEMDKWRNFDRDTLQAMLSRSRHAVSAEQDGEA